MTSVNATMLHRDDRVFWQPGSGNIVCLRHYLYLTKNFSYHFFFKVNIFATVTRDWLACRADWFSNSTGYKIRTYNCYPASFTNIFFYLFVVNTSIYKINFAKYITFIKIAPQWLCDCDFFRQMLPLYQYTFSGEYNYYLLVSSYQYKCFTYLSFPIFIYLSKSLLYLELSHRNFTTYNCNFFGKCRSCIMHLSFASVLFTFRM